MRKFSSSYTAFNSSFLSPEGCVILTNYVPVGKVSHGAENKFTKITNQLHEGISKLCDLGGC